MKYKASRISDGNKLFPASIETQKNGINVNVEHIDVSTAKSTKADVIVTSNELVKNLEGHGAEIIVIKNFFDKEEIEGAFKERKLI